MMDDAPQLFVGQAGWSLSGPEAATFAGHGTHLERYARVLTAVEINTSFYRPHQPKTYALWAASVPPDFRFAVKVPKTITHQLGLARCTAELHRFLDEATCLGGQLGPLLVQLPPKQAFDVGVAGAFFEELGGRFSGSVVCEPRHPTWFQPDADAMLARLGVGRVAVDPAPVPGSQHPGGDLSLQYFRWHGSPRMYYSNYGTTQLRAFKTQVDAALTQARQVWCIFDNTAAGHALGNALQFAGGFKEQAKARLPSYKSHHPECISPSRS